MKQYHSYKIRGYSRELIFKGNKFDWKKFLKSKYAKDLQHANYKIVTHTVNY